MKSRLSLALCFCIIPDYTPPLIITKRPDFHLQNPDFDLLPPAGGGDPVIKSVKISIHTICSYPHSLRYAFNHPSLASASQLGYQEWDLVVEDFTVFNHLDVVAFSDQVQTSRALINEVGK